MDEINLYHRSIHSILIMIKKHMVVYFNSVVYVSKKLILIVACSTSQTMFISIFSLISNSKLCCLL
jgi:hypothetical protein